MEPHLHTTLIFFLLLCSPWPSTGTIYWTHLGTRCMEDCQLYGTVYMCKTVDKDERCQTMYCSPKKNMDYWGRECTINSACEKHGKDYYWCKTNTYAWGYCGLVMEDKNHYGSYTSELCYNHCEKRNEIYHWCNTAKGWDYCSPFENIDYKNKNCKDDSPCGKKGQNYYWCKLKEGSWGYCGLVEPKMLLHRTKNHHVCIDECQYYESWYYGNYYWCHTSNDWDFCSPDVDVTYKDKPCRSNHYCGLHGYSYNWCWTSESEYDYCGSIESGECSYVTSQHRNKRAPEDRILICTRKDKDNKKETIFTAELATADITENTKWENEASNLISRWNNGYLVHQARSQLITSDNLRIDMQGLINRNNQHYYNLQIQVNVRRNSRSSTTVSQIIVPAEIEIPDRYIRHAFWESFRRRARVFVEVSTQSQC